ncbi:MAG: restriction endonuclease subunit S [Lysobacterales bacterium]|nr:MAG: restriction endonuclease subunit S [Xanthomonadales bacterium]
MSVVLSAHLPLLASAPDGIQKLRGLILELAVRGKLVPQDPKDEPASELLRRITQERTRLEAEGACRKFQAEQVHADEQPFDAPDGWAWVRLTHFGEFRGGKTPSTNRSEYWDGTIPWVSPKDMKSLVVSKTEDYVSDLAVSDGLSVIPASSVLVVVRSGILRRTVPVAINSQQCTVNQDLKALCLTLPDMAQYVQLLIMGFERLILETLTKVGTTVESIKFDEFAAQPFPLPPLAEQHRIVAKVDELMALCDQLEAEQTDAEAAHARLVETLLGTLTQSIDATELAANWQRLAEHFDTLFTTESSLDALKQTILQLAVMGKLVPQDPDDEPASELLKRIAKERARLKAEGVCKKSTLLPAVGEDEQPFDAPSTWQWQRLDELLAITGGVTLGRKLSGRELISRPYLRVANVQRGHLLLEHIKTIEIATDELGKYRLQNSDLLITEGGDWDKVGRTAIWRNEIDECLHQNHVFRARPIVEDWNCRWTEMYLNAKSARDYFAASSKQTTNLASINMTQLKACPFPVPPLAEQHRIVAKVDELTALCDRLKADLIESRNRQARLSATLIESALQTA